MLVPPGGTAFIRTEAGLYTPFPTMEWKPTLFASRFGLSCRFTRSLQALAEGFDGVSGNAEPGRDLRK